MDNYRTKENPNSAYVFSNFAPEDIGLSSNHFERKKTGVSDPRFKKIIDAELQNDTRQSESKTQKSKIEELEPELFSPNQDSAEKLLTFLKLSENCSLFKKPNSTYVADQKENDLSDEVTKDIGFQLPDKISRNYKMHPHNNIQNQVKREVSKETEKTKNNYATDLKKSMSDCTLQTPLKENESDENARLYSSSTKLFNYDNSTKPQKNHLEKRRSVVTVIGQTQMKSFNELLNEIQQRRKLAKELDKHALCEALMNSVETFNQSKFKNIITKVDFILPDGKVIYTTEKVYSSKNNTHENTGCSNSSIEILGSGDKRRKYEVIPEKDLSSSQQGKRKSRRMAKKSVLSISDKTKSIDNLRGFLEDFPPRIFWLILSVLFIGLGFSFFFYISETPQTYYILQIFRPKTTHWYEKFITY